MNSSNLVPESKTLQSSTERRSEATLNNLTAIHLDREQSQREHDAWFRSRTICVACQSIFQRVYEWERIDFDPVVPTNHDLCSSAQHCPICQLFLSGLYGNGLQEDLQVWDYRNILASRVGYRWPEPGSGFKGIQWDIWQSDSGAKIKPESLWESKKRSVVGRSMIYMFKTTEKEEMLQAASVATDCPRSWAVVRRWMEECKNHHQACRPSIPHAKLPSRLVEVGVSDDELRLRLSEQLATTSSYVTLSHCWGSKPFLTLNSSNLELFMANIPFFQLSKTFRDAILSTRRLGFQYIWIDSLCIIQGDHKDWSQEAATMGEVYANSALNLAAIDSPDGDGGLFEHRDKKILGWRVKTNSEAYILPSHETSVWDCVSSTQELAFENSVLASRAWAFQERFLAPRNLNFGKEELSWECRTKRAYEVSPISPFGSTTVPGIITKVDVASYEEQWSQVVRHYSRGKLTFPSDKMAALSGIAKLFALKSGKSYIAGMWKEDFVIQMLWETRSPQRKIQTHRAPSWSWISVDGEVQLPTSKSFKPSSPIVTVEDYFVELPQAVFDDVNITFVRLRCQALVACRVKKFWVPEEETGWGYNGKYMIHVPGYPYADSKFPYHSQLRPDDTDFISDGEFFMLKLIRGSGLVVKPISDGSFMRVGCYKGSPIPGPEESKKAKDMSINVEMLTEAEIAQKIKEEGKRLTARERELSGEPVGLDKCGKPLYIIKLV